MNDVPVPVPSFNGLLAGSQVTADAQDRSLANVEANAYSPFVSNDVADSSSHIRTADVREEWRQVLMQENNKMDG